jgi:hypothetical protein
LPHDEVAIRGVLAEYQGAYTRLDARAAKEIWPRVDERALSRAFSNLESQEITFESCRTMIGSDTARATCNGKAMYVGRLGNRRVRAENRSWTFSLRKEQSGWKLEDVTVR